MVNLVFNILSSSVFFVEFFIDVCNLIIYVLNDLFGVNCLVVLNSIKIVV